MAMKKMIFKKNEYANDYRTFLVALFKKIEQVFELKGFPKSHGIKYKQQSDVYVISFAKVKSLGNCLKRGKCYFIKSWGLNLS